MMLLSLLLSSTLGIAQAVTCEASTSWIIHSGNSAGPTIAYGEIWNAEETGEEDAVRASLLRQCNAAIREPDVDGMEKRDIASCAISCDLPDAAFVSIVSVDGSKRFAERIAVRERALRRCFSEAKKAGEPVDAPVTISALIEADRLRVLVNQPGAPELSDCLRALVSPIRPHGLEEGRAVVRASLQTQ